MGVTTANLQCGSRRASISRSCRGLQLPKIRTCTHLRTRTTVVAAAPNGVTNVAAKAPNSTNIKWPTFKPDAKFIRPEGKYHKTILTIDGGGLRGMLAARLLEDLEMAIKHCLLEERPDITDAQGKRPPPNGEFNIDLADYFDVMSGTSTGAIIATYLATKGRLSQEFLLRDNDMQAVSGSGARGFNTKFEDVRAYQQRFSPQFLRPGSCRAIQAVFAAKAEKIFPKNTDLKDLLLGKANDFIKVKYPAEGVNRVLKGVFGGVDIADALQPSPTDKRLSSPDVLFTSLVIPSFQLNLTRTMTFWYKHNAEPALRRFGYGTLARSTRNSEQQNAMKLMDEWFGGYVEEHQAKNLGPGMSEIVYVPNVDFNLWQVVRSSTAAPTYFPPITLFPILPPSWIPEAEDSEPGIPAAWKMVDGGLTANNPGSAALAFTTSAFPEVTRLDQLAVMSIGCGTVMGPTDVDDEAGQLVWIPSLINALMGGNQELSSALLDHIISKKYINTPSAVSDLSDRYVRIQKSVFQHQPPPPPAGKGKGKEKKDEKKGANEDNKMITVGGVPKSVAQLLADMDITDSKIHYIALAEDMLSDTAQDMQIQMKYKRFVKDYLLPDPANVVIAAKEMAAQK